MSWFMIHELDDLDDLDDVSAEHYGPCCETGECESDRAVTGANADTQPDRIGPEETQ